MTKFLGWFVAGAMSMFLLAANSGSFRLGDEPELTNAFTYHGQLKSGGDPYGGLADVRLTLWNDAFTGVQVGRTADFEGVTVEDGLFAVEPDFGPDAFNGARRWIEVAVRAPAGSGGYLTLDPRQAVNATPYALYALNGQIGPEGPQGPPGDDRWEVDESDTSIWTEITRIGVGGPPPANTALSIDGDFEGDGSVILPSGSISTTEITGGLSAARLIPVSGNAGSPSRAWSIQADVGNTLTIQGVFTSTACGPIAELMVNGQSVGDIRGFYGSSSEPDLSILSATVELVQGENVVELSLCTGGFGSVSGTITFIRSSLSLELTEL
ncbi:hypothetical protein OAG62_00010 [bacterium]|nr:hypothetical protein [bacterium]